MAEAVAQTERMVEIDENELARLKSIAEHHERIMIKQREVAKLRDKYLAEKDRCLAAKKTMDQAINELGDMIGEGPDKQLKLFDTNGEDSQPETNWQQMSIDRLGVTPAIKKKLVDCGVATLGDLVMLYIGKKPEFPEGLKDVKGFGPGKIETLKEAMRKLVPERDMDGPRIHDPVDEVEDEEQEDVPQTAVDMVDAEVDDVSHAYDDESEDVAVDDDPIDTVDDVSSVDDQQPQEPADDTVVKRIRLTKDVFADVGLTEGSEHDATFRDNNTAEIPYEGGDEPMLLVEGEYELV